MKYMILLLCVVILIGCDYQNNYESPKYATKRDHLINADKGNSFSNQMKLEDKQNRIQAENALNNATSLEDFLKVQRDNWMLGLESIDVNYISLKRRNWYVENNPNISDEVMSLILAGKWKLGMTKNELLASIGIPEKINRTNNSGGTFERWIYEYDIRVPRTSTTCFYFDNGILSSWQD